MRSVIQLRARMDSKRCSRSAFLASLIVGGATQWERVSAEVGWMCSGLFADTVADSVVIILFSFEVLTAPPCINKTLALERGFVQRCITRGIVQLGRESSIKRAPVRSGARRDTRDVGKVTPRWRFVQG